MLIFSSCVDVLSGRALFSYDPSLFRDDDEADLDEYVATLANEEDDLEDKPSMDADDAAKVIDQKLCLNDDDAIDLEDME